MNSLIESLNDWGARFVDFALPLLWQSSLLIAVVFACDFLLRRKVRAAVRYSLWFVIFIKLLLPPTLALPTGAAWWLRGRPAPVVVSHARKIVVNYSQPVDSYVPPVNSLTPVVQPDPKLSREAILLIAAVAAGSFLMLWVLFRWRQIARCVRQTTTADEDVLTILAQAHALAGLRKNVTLRVTEEAMSPAVCGLFRPVILLPRSLIEKLVVNQLRAVLLHELIHLRRRDVSVNCAQTLLQIVYWWHPLLWVANARMRRVREEAVDDAVMCALNAEAEVYAPTLLEVAKLAFSRPLASLGLVGILESRNALRHRIERLLNFTTPRRAGVSMVSLICLAAFTALAVPMGEPPARPAQVVTNETGGKQIDKLTAKVTESQSNKNSLSENGHPEIPRIYRTNAPLPPPPGPGTNLITFTFQLDPNDFNRRLTNFATQHNLSWIPNQEHLLVNFLAEGGVMLYPPKSFSLHSDNRSLTMRATKEDQQKTAELLGLNLKTSTNAPELHTRMFNLDVNGLYSNLQNIVGKQSQTLTNFGTVDDGQKRDSRLIYNIDTEHEMRLSVGNFFNALGVNLAPPKGFAFFERESLLTVRATDEDLKLIEQVIHTLTNYPPELQITIQTYELSDDAFSAFQLKWFSKLEGNNNEAKGWVAGILTAPAFNSVLKTLDAKNAKDLLSKQEVTTLSGRQANFAPREPDVLPQTPVGGSVNYGFAHPLELDLVPKVDADGYTIQMTLIPTGTEFVGAGSDTNFVPASTSGGIPIMGQLPLPHSRVRQLVTSCTLWDGQTAVLVLKPPYAETNKMLVVFVTPVIIDPSGNRKNAAGSLPFAEKTVPSQTGH